MLGGGPPVHLMWSSTFNPDRPKTTRKVDLRRILALFRPYAREEALVLVCILIGSLLGLLPALFTKWLIDGAIAAKDMHGVWLDVGGMVATALVAGVLGVFQGYLNSLVGEGIMRDIRTSLVAHLHTHAALVLHRHQDRRDHEPRLVATSTTSTTSSPARWSASSPTC